MSNIDYDLSQIKGIALDIDGVLSPSTCPLSPSGHPTRMGNVKDGYAMQLAVKSGLSLAVISGGESLEMANRMNFLGVKDVWQKTAHKLPVLKEWMAVNNFRPEETLYMGDDIPDLQCLHHVGLPCCPLDAVWEVKEASVYISKFPGGYGAVRDVIEQVMKAQGLWNPYSDDSLIW